MAILVFIDGVLRNSANAPIPNGMSLYRTLKEQNRVLIMCADKEKDDHWLRQHRVNNLDDLVDYQAVPSPQLGDDPNFRMIEWVRSQGPVDFVVTSDPELTNKLLHIGLTVLVFMNPIYIKEEFRPDSRKGVKSWQDIAAEIAKQQDDYSEDRRIN